MRLESIILGAQEAVWESQNIPYTVDTALRLRVILESRMHHQYQIVHAFRKYRPWRSGKLRDNKRSATTNASNRQIVRQEYRECKHK